MNEHDQLNEAVKALKNCDVPVGPPPQTVDETLAALQEAAEDWNPETRVLYSAHAATWITWAVAAGVLILLGFSAGRFTTPGTLDEAQIVALETRLRSSLEPAITQQIGQALSRDLQAIQTASYTVLNEALDQGMEKRLGEHAIQVLAASNASTNRLLENLVQAIQVAQVQERQRLAAVFQDIEFDRLQKDTEVRKSLANVKVLTENHLQTTQELMSLIAHEQAADRME